jgi:GT2 family glycosyltransferase
MTMPPKVSVIVATCRRVPRALECLASVLSNAYPNFEVIVVDQDPARELEAALEAQFPDEERLAYIFLNVQMLSRARNVGMAAATGDIYIFLDDDAVVDPGWIAAYVDAFLCVHPTPGAVAGRLCPRWAAPVPAWAPEDKLYMLGIYDKGPRRMRMPEGDLPIGANFAVLREVAEQIGAFREELGFSYARKDSMLAGEDSLFTMEIRSRGYPLYYEPRAVADHLISANKLRLSYFAKRNFWEGVTLMMLLFLSGSISRASCAGIVSHHVRSIVFEIFAACVRRHPGDSRIPGRKKLVRAMFQCCYSAGIISRALRLWRTGTLP